ncbi:MAG: histidine phosphatase family protein, partial [Patescibacteria group bacterium]
MKTLIIVRHGEEEPNGIDLTVDGVKAIIALVQMIEDIVKNQKIMILSSDKDRAVETAMIIQRIIRKERPHFAETNILWTEDSKGEKLDDVLKLVLSYEKEYDVIIMVTHTDYVRDFPPFFAKKQLNKNLHPFNCMKGEGLILDCSEMTLKK